MQKADNNSKLEVKNLWHSFQLREGPLSVLEDINLKVLPGEFVSIVGTSGCGKTTLLNILAGFIKPSKGEAYVDGEPITGPSGKRGMVFQSMELFRWLTVKGNVEFGLKIKGLKKDERERIANYYIELVGLKKFKERYVYELSGGMKQRVAVARSFANSPEVLLMDEPMGALDAQTRALLQEELLKIWNETKNTIIFITHSVEEAVFLSNRVIVFSRRPGQIKEQILIDIPIEDRSDFHIKKSKKFLDYTFHLLESVREELEKLQE